MIGGKTRNNPLSSKTPCSSICVAGPSKIAGRGYIPPVLRSGGTLTGPGRIVIEVVRDLGWPETRDIAVINVTLHGLAEASSPARRIDLPARKEGKRTSAGYVRLLRGRHVRASCCNAKTSPDAEVISCSIRAAFMLIARACFIEPSSSEKKFKYLGLTQRLGFLPRRWMGQTLRVASRGTTTVTYGWKLWWTKICRLRPQVKLRSL